MPRTKITLLLFFTLLNLASFSQLKNNDSTIAQLKCFQAVIVAKEYKNGQVVKTINHINKYNKYGRTIEVISYNKGKKTGTVKYNYIDSCLQINKVFDKKKKLQYTTIWLRNAAGDLLQKYDLSPKGDTLNNQRWILNNNGKEAALYNNKKLAAEWDYDENGNMVSEKIYKDKNIIVNNIYSYKKIDSCYEITRNLFGLNNQKTKKCITNNSESYTFDEDGESYLYGIKLIAKKGGKKIYKRDNNGLLQSITYSDEIGNILALITYGYNR